MDLLSFLAPLGILLGLALLGLCLCIFFYLLKVREEFRQMQICIGQLLVFHGRDPGSSAAAGGVCTLCGRRHSPFQGGDGV